MQQDAIHAPAGYKIPPILRLTAARPYQPHPVGTDASSGAAFALCAVSKTCRTSHFSSFSGASRLVRIGNWREDPTLHRHLTSTQDLRAETLDSTRLYIELISPCNNENNNYIDICMW